MDKAEIGPGNRVIDIGCGFGTTTYEIARRVGPTGQVIGIDFSEPMIAEAERRRSPELDTGTDVTFIVADIQSHAFEAGWADVMFSRYGVMFYDDPVKAFSNMRTGLRSGGRIAFVCWRAAQDNPWMSKPMKIAREFIEMPPPPGPEEPGIFGFADRQRVQAILEAADFTEIDLQPLDLFVKVGATIDTAVKNAMTVAPWAALLADQDAPTLTNIGDAIANIFADYESADGVIIPAASWLASAVA
ncbi:MAG: class I SAM-dependent methyltransferase [Alphaproteobacteria bacterium]|nr:class I SAM-dependent methyltransferase [Alphaproteobacteria bacterium]